ncbi:MAG: hypothetical protein RIQ60_1227 [Pseudomonadota bacterium]|jgi:hypothetical protein
MVVLGNEYAASHPLPAVDELGQLEHAVNQLWTDMHWGRAVFKDSGHSLHIVHECAPLADAFGASNLGWSSGLLEGMYGGWLRQAGAPAHLELRRLDPAGPDQAGEPLEFILAVPVRVAPGGLSRGTAVLQPQHQVTS